MMRLLPMDSGMLLLSWLEDIHTFMSSTATHHPTEFCGITFREPRKRRQSMSAADELPPPVLCTNVVLTTLEPLQKTGHVKTIDPTATDMLTMDSFLPVFVAYRLADNSDARYEQVLHRIKDGLRKVLVPFFPWAGRWIAISGGRGRQLLCNDKGIPFIEAFVDQNLDSVVRLSAAFQPVPELQGYHVLGMNPMHFRHPMLPDGLPCAFIQVTRFKCGGLVIAVTFNHMITDGKSLFDFMKAWSDFSRTDRTDMICDHNRAALGLADPASLPPDTFVNTPPTHKWEVKSYEVSASIIESLKREVKLSAEGAYVSTMDCIFAHMWKSLSSLSFSVTGGKEIGVLNSVEGRTRFYDPPLPNLLGNVQANMRTPSYSTAELLKMPLSVIASKIREKMLTTSREAWLSPERVEESLDAFTNPKVLPWGQSCWSSFPIYKIDFGFGNPFFAPGLNTSLSWDMFGMSYVGPPTPGVFSSAAFTVIRSTPDVLDALEHQSDFLHFFLPDKGGNPLIK